MTETGSDNANDKTISEGLEENSVQSDMIEPESDVSTSGTILSRFGRVISSSADITEAWLRYAPRRYGPGPSDVSTHL